MVHNGIEYGLMQAYAEGFDILKNANIDALPETTASISTCPTSPRSGGAAA
jgi:6-phosphogluconate dehydrogenase (decarboxylating)